MRNIRKWTAGGAYWRWPPSWLPGVPYLLLLQETPMLDLSRICSPKALLTRFVFSSHASPWSMFATNNLSYRPIFRCSLSQFADHMTPLQLEVLIWIMWITISNDALWIWLVKELWTYLGSLRMSVDFFYLYDKAAGLLESKIVFLLTLADRGRPCFVFSN